MNNKSYSFPMRYWAMLFFAFCSFSTVSAQGFNDCLKDKTAPMIFCPSNITAYAYCGVKCVKVNFDVRAMDNCDLSPKVRCEYAADYCFPIGTTEAWCWAEDKSGNVAKCSFKVTIIERSNYNDVTAPLIYCPIDIYVKADCGEKCAKVSFDTPRATDDCGIASVTCDKKSGDCFPVGSTKVNCMATDLAGHMAKCYFNVIVMDNPDTKPPTIKCPSSVEASVKCDDKCTEVKTGKFEVYDECDPKPSVFCDYDEDYCFKIGTTTVSCYARDKSGNKSDLCTYKVTVKQIKDTEAPKIKCPKDVYAVVECDECAKVKCGAEAWDNCDKYPKVWCDFDDDHCFEVGKTEVWCYAEDKAGNKSKCSYTVTVKAGKDKTPPVIKCPDDITDAWLNCKDDCLPVYFKSTTAKDNCDPNPIVTCDYPYGYCFPLGTTEVWCKATDASGNTSKCSFNVTISPAMDMTPPKIKCPADVTGYADCGECGKVKIELPIARDECDPDPEVWADADSDYCFEVGTTEVWGFARDEAGNKSKCSFNVTIKANKDVTPPVITCPKNVVTYIDCNEKCAKVKCGADAIDECDRYPEVWCDFDDRHCYELGTTEVWCHAKDKAGNESKCSYKITVEEKDKTPPVIKCPENIVDAWLSCTDNCLPVYFKSTTAKDNCDPNPIIKCDYPYGYCFKLGTTKVTCTATDASGNFSKCSFDVTVRNMDMNPPKITCPADVVEYVDCKDNCTTVKFDMPVATDDCDPNPYVWCENVSGERHCLGTKEVWCWAKDAAGHQSTCSFKITVKRKDTTKPVIKCRNDLDVYADCSAKCARVSWWMEPEATDDCDPSPKIACNYDKLYCFPVGSTVVKCTATDAGGNVGECSYIVRVIPSPDTKAPVITCSKNKSVMTLTNACVKVIFDDPIATDNCDQYPEITCNYKSGDCFKVGTTLVTHTATDKAGNSAKCTFTVTVMMTGGDFRAPVSENTTATAVAPTQLSQKGNTDVTNTTYNLKAQPVAHYDFTVYPNPTENFVTLQLQEFQGKKVQVQMFNTLGQQVYNANLNEASSELYKVDMQNFTSGTYFIKVAAEGVAPTAKMVIKK
jgi:large repetitive protein